MAENAPGRRSGNVQLRDDGHIDGRSQGGRSQGLTALRAVAMIEMRGGAVW